MMGVAHMTWETIGVANGGSKLFAHRITSQAEREGRPDDQADGESTALARPTLRSHPPLHLRQR